jgi:hypothetical protein
VTAAVLRSATGPDPEVAHGRADLHVHTLASDGVSGVEEILAFVVAGTWLDVIAVADHERVDAAHAPGRSPGRVISQWRSSSGRR